MIPTGIPQSRPILLILYRPQVYESLQRHAPVEVDVQGYFGGFNSRVKPISRFSSTIIVATPERLDAILRSQDLYPSLRTVIFDEAHGIENGVRGARLESLITRLRLQQAMFKDIRIVLLSAVLSDVERLRIWLGPDTVHCSDTWRPTARRLGIWLNTGDLRWVWGADPLRPSDKRATDSVGSKKLTWPEYTSPASRFPEIQAQKPAAFRNAAYLARYLLASIGGPVLLACATKANTRGLASAIASGLPEIVEPSTIRDNLMQTIRRDHPHLTNLSVLISKGVAYHNASLPQSVREGIENALKARSLNFVAATTTLAEGVDLPFRVTILFDWLIGFGDQQTPMASLLFRNIAGRCGRAGEFAEGDTIIFDNVLGDLAYTGDNSRRRRAQFGLFADPPPLQSVIANDNLSEEIKSAVYSVVGSQFLASIPENVNDPVLEETWAGATFAAAIQSSPVSMIRQIRAEILSVEHGEPFARAASPMLLTPLGVAANRCGFGPQTCRMLLSYLQNLDSTPSICQLASDLLITFGACAEQSNYLLRAIAQKKRTQFYVKSDDLSLIAEGWLAGYELTKIFLTLPRAIKSKAAVKPVQWVQGNADWEPVAAQFDKFVDVTEYAFGGFLPWILRAAGALAAFGSVTSVRFDWEQLSIQFAESRLADLTAIDESATSRALE